MAGIVQGIPAGINPPPELGDKAIPVEATAKRELKSLSPQELAEQQFTQQLLLGIMNELMILNNRMFPGSDLTSERTGLAYEQRR